MYIVYLYYKDEKDPKIYEGFNTLKEAKNFCKINQSLIESIELYKITNEEESLYFNSNFHSIKTHGFLILNNRRVMEIILNE